MTKPKPNTEPISLYWALLVGLLTMVAQLITYYLRFERLNTQASLTEYLLLFLAGSLGGLILIFFLNRQPTTRGRWVVVIMFLLITPLSLFLMLGGALFGVLGLLLLPQIPWALFSWLGSLLGRLVSRT